MTIIPFLLLCVTVANSFKLPRVGTNGKHWAVLVAGSNTYDNYRHQADVCHAYQILHDNGIPDEQIVVMMYDDIAYNEQNPTPGIIINHPQGSNVYHGVLKDYTGKDVTPANFLNVLQGKKGLMAGIGSGKVIDSGPDDYIFVNLVDHGAPGLFGFPSKVLYAKELNEVLQSMHKEKRYKQMVVYIESCESGSMFNNLLPKDINVYGTTASNPSESSYACYFSKKYSTYLGDVYSVKWMEDSDKGDLHTESLQTQFRRVKKETNTSHVQEYGDFTISNEDVDVFQGDDSSSLHFHKAPLQKVQLNAMVSENVSLSVLDKTGNTRRYALVLKEHGIIKCQMNKIVNLSARNNALAERYLTEKCELTFYNCYESVARKYLSACRRDTEGNDGFNLRQMFALVNMCQDMVKPRTIIAAIEDVCGENARLYCV